MDARTRDRILFLLFLVSGFCGLTYQVVWLRLAFAAFGIITPVMSVVISVFMLGLALGSWGAGRWVSDWTRRTNASALYAYALAELVIGAGAFAAPPLLQAGRALLLPLGAMDSGPYLFWSGLALAAAILPWCVAMGATFPLVMAFVKEVERSETHSFSFLYLANVIGAMLGALITAVALVELFGFRGTLRIAAIGNFAIAAASVWLARRHGRPANAAAVDPALPGTDGAPLAPGDARLALVILFVTGFTSMGGEVIWVRNLTPVLGTLVYSFASLLATYLFATWLGSAWYRRDLARGAPLSVDALVAGLAVASWLPLVLNDARVHASAAPGLASIVPFCALLGYLTPMLVDRYAQGAPRAGGRGYAVNVVGSILGPLFASYVLLPTVGVRLGLVLLAQPYLVLFALHARSRPRALLTRATAAAALALFGCALFWTTSYEEGAPWIRNQIRRDYAATVLSWGAGPRRQLAVNGIGQTGLVATTKVMAHMPLALVPQPPRRALVICFGMGTTFRALLSWGVEATAVELIPSVPEAFPYYHADAERVRADPHGRVVIDDGRRFLQRDRTLYDVITLDPSPPIEAAGASLLYSSEFYQLARQRLAPGGILLHWFPGGGDELTFASLIRSLTEAFPYVRIFPGYQGFGHHLLASEQPIEIPPPRELAARLPERARADLIEWNSAALRDPETLFREIFAREVAPESLLHPDPRIRLVDDRPRNEYYLLRRHAPWLWQRLGR